MGATVKELQTRMDSAEFAEHMAAYALEPWGDDWQQATGITAAIINCNSRKQVKFEDLMPGKMAKQEATAAQVQAKLDMALKAAQKRQERLERRNRRKQEHRGDERIGP